MNLMSNTAASYQMGVGRFELLIRFMLYIYYFLSVAHPTQSTVRLTLNTQENTLHTHPIYTYNLPDVNYNYILRYLLYIYIVSVSVHMELLSD